MICLKCRCDAIRTKWCLTLRNIQSNTRTTINDDDCFNTTDIPKIDQMNCFILIKMSILTRYAGSGLLNPWLFQYFQSDFTSDLRRFYLTPELRCRLDHSYSAKEIESSVAPFNMYAKTNMPCSHWSILEMLLSHTLTLHFLY